tara:strand:+ start:774 stop:2738 length:1965 start_codon:yes stop_codon:yes gene_type:complete
MKTKGSVLSFKLDNSGSTAKIVTPLDENGKSPISLGYFILLTSGEDNIKYLGNVKELVPLNNEAYEQSVIDSLRASQEIDDFHKDEKERNVLVYDVEILGVCKETEDGVEYYSSVRTLSQVNKMEIEIPSAEYMRKLLLFAVQKSDNESKDVIFDMGVLKYGTFPGYSELYKEGSKNQVTIKYNASNVLRKRTAVFGKSGYGKSNNNKVLIGMMSKEHPNCGQLILDTNGEYALDNSQNDGLMDIFTEAGYKNKCVLYTQRKISKAKEKNIGKQNFKQLRFDVFHNIKPALEIVKGNITDSEPLYLQSWTNSINEDEDKLFSDIPNKNLVWAFWYAGLHSAGLNPVNVTHTKGVLPIKKTYLDNLLWTKHQEALDAGIETIFDEDADEREVNWDRLDDVMKSRVLEKEKIVQENNRFKTNHIPTMIKYAIWYSEDEKNSNSSLKGYMEIIKYPRRFYVLKSFHIENKEGGIEALGNSIWDDLSNHKIVIIDTASVPIKVAKALNAHILETLLTKASAMFGDSSMNEVFSKWDALIYIEEAQNFLSPENIKQNAIYERIAKEGRKFHLGLVYITQQPSAIDKTITSQTENIIALHMSNEKDVKVLNEIKDKFSPLVCKFLKDEASKGLSYIYSEPHQPFVIPCQVFKFDKKMILK